MDEFQFAERLLVLLEEGRKTATYKFAVLLALIDLCLQDSDNDGHPPQSVTSRQLAEKVLEYYWPQQRPYVEDGVTILRQNAGARARIIAAIARFRERFSDDPYLRPDRARRRDPVGFKRMLDDVEWSLIQMPLPRLQRLGRFDDRFIFEIGWTEEVTRASAREGFDNRILFKPRAAEHLVRMAPLLRPLVQRRWSDLVANMNTACVSERRLDEFLFGASRISLAPLRAPLLDLQKGRCLYCQTGSATPSHVDHFIPWSRYPDNSIQNLVVAHDACNRFKCDYLAAPRHVRSWRERNGAQRRPLQAIADAQSWESHEVPTLAVARGIYFRLPTGTPLWDERDRFEPTDVAAVRDAFQTH